MVLDKFPTAAVFAPVADQLSNTGTARADLSVWPQRHDRWRAELLLICIIRIHHEVPGLYDSDREAARPSIVIEFREGITWACYINIPGLRRFQLVRSSKLRPTARLCFYTIYLKPTLSLSFAGGPQHYEATQSPFSLRSRGRPPAQQAWAGRDAAQLLRPVIRGA